MKLSMGKHVDRVGGRMFTGAQSALEEALEALVEDVVVPSLEAALCGLLERVQKRYSALWEHPGCTGAQRWAAIDALLVRPGHPAACWSLCSPPINVHCVTPRRL